jgi:hypothetical protein
MILNPKFKHLLVILITISRLAKKNPFPDMEWIPYWIKLKLKAKAKHKLPNWFATNKIIYPSKISIEQTSSKKLLTSQHSFRRVSNWFDGGFGVDDYYFSKKK